MDISNISLYFYCIYSPNGSYSRYLKVDYNYERINAQHAIAAFEVEKFLTVK